jgi:hypothetical protein
MGGTGQRDLGRRQAVTIRRAAFDQGQRLQRLDGGARKDRFRNIAKRENHAAVGVADGERAAMPAFDAVVPQDLDQDWIVHLSRVRPAASSSP